VLLYFFFLFFFVIVLFAVSKDRQSESLFYILIGLILFLIAGFRTPGIDKDYWGYVDYYNDILYKSFVNVEPSFILITNFVHKTFHDYKVVFIIYAFCGVSIKLFAINRLTQFTLLSLLVYFGLYFVLQEMTQIRAGVASGLLLLSIKPIKEKKIWTFLGIFLIACTVHFSCIIMLPLYFLSSDKINVYVYALLLPFAYVVYFSGFSLLSLVQNLIPIPLVQVKMSSYNNYAAEDNTINLFNVVHLMKCALSYVFLINYKLIAKKNEYGILLIKIYIIALFIFVALAQVPAMSSRMGELLMVVEIVLIPFLMYIFRPKVFSLSVIVGIALFMLSFSLLYTKLLLFK
jgi:hypothetical protein